VPGRKSDVNDATWMADLLAHGLIRASFVPPAPENAEAAFDAALAIARARTLEEVGRLQADFTRQQLAIAIANAQTQELLQLSAKIAIQTFETATAAATNTLEQLRKIPG
jgi:hypothetical protein